MFHVALAAASAAAAAVGASYPSTTNIDPTAEAALRQFMGAWQSLHTITYRFTKEERLRNGAIGRAENFVKFRKPFQIYVELKDPPTGQEVIYDASRNPDDLLVHPGTFPDLTLSLDIRGRLVSKGEHHIVTHLGFGYTLDALKRIVALARSNPAGEKLTFLGDGLLRDRPVRRVAVISGHRPPRRIRAMPGESLFTFAERVGMDAYYILYVNDDIARLSSTLRERAYDVPFYYGSKTVLVLDRETWLPLSQKTWDHEERLYERYEFYDVVVNPPLTDADFDPKNPAYDF